MKYALGTIVGTALLGLAKSKIGSNIRLTRKIMNIITLKDRRYYTYYDEAIADTDTEELIYEEINQYLSDENIVHSQDEEYEVYPFVRYYLHESEGELFEEEGEDDFWTYTFTVSVYYTYLENDREAKREAQSQLSRISSDINDIVKRHLYWVDKGTYYGDNVSQRKVDTIVNADTGEEYKAPESTIPKLRKR